MTEKGLQICISKSEIINTRLDSLDLMIIRLKKFCSDEKISIDHMMKHIEPLHKDDVGNHVYVFRWKE